MLVFPQAYYIPWW